MQICKKGGANHVDHQKTTRRSFLKKAALAGAAFTIVPREVLGRGYTAPSDTLNLGVVGGGGKGYSDSVNTVRAGGMRIGAIADVDWHMSKRLMEEYPNAKRFRDWRVMLNQIKDLDAITIATPDHTHAIIALAAMQLGKHVYVQKPLTNTIEEARILTKAARKHKIVTQMGNQGASSTGTATIVKWFNDGLIGNVDEVQVWTDRPVWPQGNPSPTEKPAMPEGMDWDGWVGPANWVDYHPPYHPFAWRGWWNFGTGALGDIGCHLMDIPYRALGLGYPTAVEGSIGAIFTRNWTPDIYPESCPPSSRIQLNFAASKANPVDLKLIWTDGGLRPFHPDQIPADHPIGDSNSANGVMMMGEKGVLTCGMYGRNPKIYFNNGDFLTEPTVKNTLDQPSNGHHYHWVNAVKAGFGSTEHKALTSSFDYAGPMTETVLMGNLAIRSYILTEAHKDNQGRDRNRFSGRKKLLWDGENMKITNFESANQFVTRTYRDGWELGKVG